MAEHFGYFLDGFSISTFESFGVSVPVPNSSGFATLAGVTIQQTASTPTSPNPRFEDTKNRDTIQRIRFSYDIVFQPKQTDRLSPQTSFPTSSANRYSLSFNLVDVGSTSLNFELVAGGNPYFSNINLNDSNTLSYLSRDLRVFSLSKKLNELPGDTSAPKLDNQSPNEYIQALLGYINSSEKYTKPPTSDGPDPLDTLL